MLTIERVIIVLKTIQACHWIGSEPTRHVVAKNIRNVSRSTVYRIVDRMERVGLVDILGDGRCVITGEGYDFLDMNKELV